MKHKTEFKVGYGKVAKVVLPEDFTIEDIDAIKEFLVLCSLFLKEAQSTTGKDKLKNNENGK